MEKSEVIQNFMFSFSENINNSFFLLSENYNLLKYRYFLLIFPIFHSLLHVYDKYIIIWFK